MRLFSRKGKNELTGVCSVVVVAAGSSTRMGSDKILINLAGVPAIIHSLRTFENMPEVGEIVVVTREDLIPSIAALCRDHRITKVTNVIRGGSSRVESSRLGTLAVNSGAKLIAIHDGARPLVPEEVVRMAIVRGMETGAAAPAIPLKDTVKAVNNGLVESTLDRSTLRAIQTPQVFDSALIRAALQSALDDRADITDDCSAVERMGMKVSLTEGSERNFKLTTPTDLLLAECFLQEGRVR